MKAPASPPIPLALHPTPAMLAARAAYTDFLRAQSQSPAGRLPSLAVAAGLHKSASISAQAARRASAAPKVTR